MSHLQKRAEDSFAAYSAESDITPPAPKLIRRKPYLTSPIFRDSFFAVTGCRWCGISY